METDSNKAATKPRRRKKKASPRSDARELAVQMMYQADITGEGPLQVVETFLKMYQAEEGQSKKDEYALRMRNKPEKESFQFAKELFFGAYTKIGASDDMVIRFLRKDWTLDRLNCIVKSIFRLAIYELMDTDTPSFAVLTDYVNLAYSFDDEKAAVFVNGLLEKVRLSALNAEV
jgi:N utilization substance protein B